MELEPRATVMQMYMSQIVPGLLQTEKYARELPWSTPHLPEEEDAMEEQLALRMSRQDVLRNGDAPAHLRIVLDEAVLRRPIEDREAWHLQLERLVDEAQLSNVTLQMLPFSAGLHDLLGGSLTILWLPDGSAAAYQESAKSGEVIEEPEDVVRLKLSYDRTRDLALSPQDSVEFIRSLLKDG